MAIGLQIQNGDWVIQDSAILTVEKQDKVKRDVHKFLSTDQEYDDNITSFSRYNPQYGIELNKRSLYRGLSIDSIIDQMNKSLSTSLKWFLSLQESRANLSYEEIILDMQFYVFLDPDSKTTLKLKVDLLLQGSKTYNTLGVYSQEVA
jgi:hypothetical protein